MPKVLVVCYGNPLRGDDGVGWIVAEKLRQMSLPDFVAIQTHIQLTPELAAGPKRGRPRHFHRRLRCGTRRSCFMQAYCSFASVFVVLFTPPDPRFTPVSCSAPIRKSTESLPDFG